MLPAVLLTLARLASDAGPASAQSAPPSAGLVVTVHVSPVADLAHQLDCVAGVSRACGTADYRALWRARFLRDAADSAALAAWGALRARYDVDVEVDTAELDAVGRTYARVSLAERWRVAGLQARSFADYDERLALVLLPQDRPRVAAVLARFRPRFDAWWAAGARAPLEDGRTALTTLLARADLRALLAGARRFYGVDAAGGAVRVGGDTLSLTLVARPGVVRDGTSAQVVDGWAVQELLPGAPPARDVGVTLHEVAHVLLALAPDTTRAAVAAELARGGVPGRAVRSLLDEALATAFGNGLVERALRSDSAWAAYAARPRSFYNDPVLDAAGKALVPALDSLFRAGARLGDPGVVAVVHRTLAAALGPRLASPRALLHDVWAFVDAGVADASDVSPALRRALRPGNLWVSVDSAGGLPAARLARDPWVGAVVVAPAAALARVAARGAFRAAEVPAVRRAAAAGPVLYGARRANGARTWVLVARSAAEAGPLIDRLGALEHDVDGAVRGRPGP